MFSESIEKAIRYTKPLLNGQMIYKTKEIINSINTLIVLNDEGDILTCGHVADCFKISDDINDAFIPILEELKGKSPKEIKKIEAKYGIKENDIALVHNIIVDVASDPGRLNIIKHPFLDMAIIKLSNNKEIIVNEFPIFRSFNPLIGERLCNLGFAFPEYDTFFYNDELNQIKTHNKFMHFPIFPLDGMITRNIVDQNNEITMFEINAPVLPGQAGGPILDQDGYVCGMQIGIKRISSNYNNEMPFHIDLGIGINAETIMNFLDDNHIKYQKKN